MSAVSELINTVEKRENKLGNRGWRITNERRNNELLNTQIKFRITKEMNKRLEAKAGKSKAELIRTYIEWGLENDK